MLVVTLSVSVFDNHFMGMTIPGHLAAQFEMFWNVCIKLLLLFCLNFVCIFSWFWGPVVTLQDCLAAFFARDELKGEQMDTDLFFQHKY